ncbi:sensor histidine kinase [Pseudomonas sp. RP23018S]|uniref:ATP-binding protein n=1 Tax=Pseudomonas sp. RP23018S TaxID=3096037 RepID=UPI002ACA46D6|nr:sensor histidine kinase [Pseudomonas sp. RP23018S]MDZ5603151.1 sensor histidine kinase [Pseudomonas sp. RP23018S]
MIEIQVALACVHNGTLMLRVQVHGPGIDASHAPRPPKRFYSRGSDQGAGLGLAIVEMIMNALSGRLLIGNREGRTLCFAGPTG